MLRLTALGVCGTFPAPGRACSGYLLEAARPEGPPVKVWVDAGSGTLANLLLYTSLDELDAIWVSHLHVDHCSDLPLAYYTLKYGDGERATPLPVYGPSGWGPHMASFLTADTAGQPRDMTDVFEINELGHGAVVSFGGLELAAIATRHSVETWAVRATSGGLTLAYSADTGPCDALADLADGADLFVCEAAWAESMETEPIHCDPLDAGEWARRAGAKRLLLTHLRPSVDPQAAIERARRAYDGEVGVVVEGEAYELGAATWGRGSEPT
jgi:ribonuclease BN (tRNA processing enzyme)